MLIQIGLREKYPDGFFPIKLLFFRLVVTYFGKPQIAQDQAFFVKNNSGGACPRTP